MKVHWANNQAVPVYNSQTELTEKNIVDDEDFLRIIYDAGTKSEYSKGQYIFRQGDEDIAAIHLVLNGSIKIKKIIKGEVHSLGTLRAGRLFNIPVYYCT